jgi:hypothetical protein
MRTATVVRLGVGSALLAAPGPALALADGPDRHDDLVLTVVRVLGGRLVLQAVTDVILRGRSRRLGMAVELAHAASMAAVVAHSPRHRRTASVSAALATGLALMDAAESPPGLNVVRPTAARGSGTSVRPEPLLGGLEPVSKTP